MSSAGPIVTLIQNGKVRCDCMSVLEFNDDSDLARKLIPLIEKGYKFVDQPGGWPPAAVLRELQGKGLLERKFRAITWRGPDVLFEYDVDEC